MLDVPESLNIKASPFPVSFALLTPDNIDA